jgi:hypothetical protein
MGANVISAVGHGWTAADEARGYTLEGERKAPDYTAAGVSALAMGAAALRNVRTCGIGVMADGAVRGVHALSAAQHGNAAVQKFQQGDYVGGSVDLVAGAAHAIKAMLRACFARGTHLLTPDGSKAIEEFRVGDVILSRDENDPTGPVLCKRVEEVFVRTGKILTLTVRGHRIETTAEHPFWVENRGEWVDAGELCVGDVLVGVRGERSEVESVEDQDRYETVYNLRIEDWHTYFVGEDGWSVWAHNACALTLHRVSAQGARTLLVGEGDFSYARVLAQRGQLDPALHTLVATDMIQGGYRGQAASSHAAARQRNIQWLRERGFEVLDDVDATQLSQRFPQGSFDNIIWMGAWPGVGQTGSRGSQARTIQFLRNQLISPFLDQAEQILAPEGRIFLAWQQTQGYPAPNARRTPLHTQLDLRGLVNEGGPLHGRLRVGATAEFVPSTDYPDYRPISNWNNRVFNGQERWLMYAIQRTADTSNPFQS